MEKSWAGIELVRQTLTLNSWELIVLKATFPFTSTGIMGTLPAFSLPLLEAELCGVILARAKSADFWFLFPSRGLLRPWADCYLCTSISSSVQWADDTVLPVLRSYPENQACDIICGCSLGRMTYISHKISATTAPEVSYLHYGDRAYAISIKPSDSGSLSEIIAPEGSGKGRKQPRDVRYCFLLSATHLFLTSCPCAVMSQRGSSKHLWLESRTAGMMVAQEDRVVAGFPGGN